MHKLIGDIYHALGSIHDKLVPIVEEETDEVKKKKVMDLDVDILDLRWKIATELTQK